MLFVQFSINVGPTLRLAKSDELPNQIFLLFLQSSTISITQTNWFYFVEAKAMFNVRYTLSIHSSRYKMLPCFNRVIDCDYLILLFVQYFLCCKVTTHWLAAHFEKQQTLFAKTWDRPQIEIRRKHHTHTFSFLQKFSSLTRKKSLCVKWTNDFFKVPQKNEKNWAISLLSTHFVTKGRPFQFVLQLQLQLHRNHLYFWQQAKLFELDEADEKGGTLDFYFPFCLEMEPVWASVSSE